jgi:nitrate/TMAO reductase-like tetraheme cytochrome c subunit
MIEMKVRLTLSHNRLLIIIGLWSVLAPPLLCAPAQAQSPSGFNSVSASQPNSTKQYSSQPFLGSAKPVSSPPIPIPPVQQQVVVRDWPIQQAVHESEAEIAQRLMLQYHSAATLQLARQPLASQQPLPRLNTAQTVVYSGSPPPPQSNSLPTQSRFDPFSKLALPSRPEALPRPAVNAELVSYWSQDLLSDTDASASQAGSELDALGPAQGGLKSPHSQEAPLRNGIPAGRDPHIDLYLENCYPSAITCGKCHPRIYEEWRTSAHAYAGISPMFHKFEMAIAQLSAGTIGTFCLRCHAPVAMHFNVPREISVVDYEHVIREGVTCVVCHRVAEAYTRGQNGERRIEAGSIYDPVYGSSYGEGLAQAISEKEKHKLKVDPTDKRSGQGIHLNAIRFDQLADSSYCASCHQVAVHPGIALEVVWMQYRAGPACKKGVSCQDCHMGAVPGKANGYAQDYAAVINDKPVGQPRKHSNHMFWGPITPIGHPGLFPHNEKSLRWNVNDWLNFDWRAGWGTSAYEDSVESRNALFPEQWKSSDERRDARKVVDENLRLLQIKRQSSVAVLEGSSKLDGPFFQQVPCRGNDLNFHFSVSNLSEGHNMPSGSLGAQPQLWLNVALIGPSGRRIWESGHLDSQGDLCNQQSQDVNQRRLPADLQLFNLQTQFLITGVKGTDREMCLPINVDFDQLPFMRPGAQPISVLNHPPFIRMEAHSIPPLGNKIAHYKVPGELLTEPGTYRISARLRSRMEPLYFMRFVNATAEMQQSMLDATLDLHPFSVQFEVR